MIGQFEREGSWLESWWLVVVILGDLKLAAWLVAIICAFVFKFCLSVSLRNTREEMEQAS